LTAKRKAGKYNGDEAGCGRRLSAGNACRRLIRAEKVVVLYGYGVFAWKVAVPAQTVRRLCALESGNNHQLQVRAFKGSSWRAGFSVFARWISGLIQ
jgi:hypothetical protein